MEAVKAHNEAEQGITKQQKEQNWAEARMLCIAASL